MSWSRHAKIAFIGSHGIRKTTAAHGFASVIQRAGRSVEYGREVVRDNPLGFNESAMFADPHISCTAGPTTVGNPPPPISTGPAMDCQPPST